MQTMIIISLIWWSFLNPTINLKLIIFIGLIIAISSATQDITIDALRIEQINKKEPNYIAAGASLAVVGWWTGYKLGGLFSLSICDFFEKNGIQNFWQLTFLTMIIIILICNFLLLFIHEHNSDKREKLYIELNNKLKNKIGLLGNSSKFFLYISTTVIAPILSFFKKNGFVLAISIISFIFLFKIEKLLGRMSLIFYKEIGFTKTDIGIFSKGIGWLTTISFTIVGGFLTIKMGVYGLCLLLGYLWHLQICCLQFWHGRQILCNIFWSVILDDIAASFATVAFVAFISILVDRNFQRQYALLASIGTAGRTIASSSGSLVDLLNGDWGLFLFLHVLW